MDMTVTIAGVTGLTGKALLEQLESDKRFSRIFVLSRKEIKVRSRKTELIKTDFKDTQWRKAFPTDVFFCCLGTTMKKAGSREAFKAVDYDLVIQLAQTAKEKGGRTFVGISSIGANAKSSNFYLKTKGEMEAAVSKMGFESCTFLRPSILLGERDEKRTGEKIGIKIAELFRPFMLGPLRKYRGVKAETLAAAMIQMATGNQPGIRFLESDEIQKYQ
jgi:uncharacterized protein YbjT (DUF2867 family)